MAYLRVTLGKKSIHNFFGTSLKKIVNMLKASIFSFIILNLSQKDILDFHVTAATTDVCMKQEIDSSLCRAF